MLIFNILDLFHNFYRQRYELFVSGCREPLVIFRLLNGFNDWQYIYIGCLNGSI